MASIIHNSSEVDFNTNSYSGVWFPGTSSVTVTINGKEITVQGPARLDMDITSFSANSETGAFLLGDIGDCAPSCDSGYYYLGQNDPYDKGNNEGNTPTYNNDDGDI